MYEKLPNQQLQGFDDDVVSVERPKIEKHQQYNIPIKAIHNVQRQCACIQVRDSSPPMNVLGKCQDLCLRDRTAANNLVRACSSIDFQPGKRLSLPSGWSALNNGQGEYEESVCYLSREQGRPEGLGTLVNMAGHFLFSEVCLSCKLREIM